MSYGIGPLDISSLHHLAEVAASQCKIEVTAIPTVTPKPISPFELWHKQFQEEQPSLFVLQKTTPELADSMVCTSLCIHT